MLLGYINLSKLRNVKLEYREIDGVMEECISIPLRPNFIQYIKRGYYGSFWFPIILRLAKINKHKNIHTISLNMGNGANIKEAKEMGDYEALSSIGFTRKANFEL